MNKRYFSNRRITYRDKISIMGKITLKSNEKNFIENIEIEDITYDGIKIVISDNNFLFKYLDFYEKKDGEIIIEFDYEGKTYNFKNIINWFRIYDMGERNYYILSSLKFKDKKIYNDSLINLITEIQMNNLFLPDENQQQNNL